MNYEGLETLVQIVDTETAAKNKLTKNSSRASIPEKSHNKIPETSTLDEANDIRLRRALMEIREKKEKQNNRQMSLIKEQTLQ